MHTLPPFRWRRLAAIAALAVAGGSASLLVASDHQDTAEVELNPTLDMTDLYVFPSPTPGRIVIAMNTRAFLTPAQSPTASFDPNLLYQFKIDNDGDNIEDKVIQVTSRGTGANQQVELRGPVDPPVLGAMFNTVSSSSAAVSGDLRSNLGAASGIQLFAGPRDDHFFIDLEAAFCILPDRKPVTGALAGPCALPGGGAFRPAGQAVNYVNGFNVLSIVVELPSSMIENGAPGRLGIWGSISR